MMLSLFSTLGGLLLSMFPKLIELFQSKADQKHEAELARIQTERELALAAAGFAAQAKVEELRTDQVSIQADAAMTQAAYQHEAKVLERAAPWVSTFVGTVRPIVTYLFVLELVFINAGLGYYVWCHPEMIKSVEDLIRIGNEIFSDDEMAMLGGIIGYWFGSRGNSKK
jgi:multidrug efflux pump subunit AcrA (membrane-fusion protein)